MAGYKIVLHDIIRYHDSVKWFIEYRMDDKKWNMLPIRCHSRRDAIACASEMAPTYGYNNIRVVQISERKSIYILKEKGVNNG